MTQWFPPEPGTFVAAAIADGLAERGHEVHVLTGFPNYPHGRLNPDYPIRPYRRERRSERVVIHRAPLYPSHDKTAMKRIANYASFAVSATVIARSMVPRPDIWLTYSSPATAAIPSLIAHPRMRIPSFLMIQDLWPDSVIESGFLRGPVGRWAMRALERFCGWCYLRSAGVGVISPGMRRILVERGVDPQKIYFTPNWVDDSLLMPDIAPSDELRRALGLPTGKLFMYAGNLGEMQGLGPLVEAFGRCPSVNLALVGDGVARTTLQSMVSIGGMTNVVFVASQPTSHIGWFIAASDVQIVSLKDSTLLRATMPSKVQTSMAAGRPILAHAAGDVATVITNCGAGLATLPGDVDSAVATIRQFDSLPLETLNRMGRSARVEYEAKYSPRAGLDGIESMLMQALGAVRRA